MNFKDIIKAIWQYPQHMLGLFLVLIWGARMKKAEMEKETRGVLIFRTKRHVGISLGMIIIANERASDRTVSHEYGHSRQSLYLGPLYLLVVGLPSITMNIISRFNRKFAKNYYNRWPENWADRLGGVKRD